MTINLLQEDPWKNLSEVDIALLKGRGYILSHPLGSGQTRDAWNGAYERGEVKKQVVVKIPKLEIDDGSVCTLINRSKRDLDAAECEILSGIAHPYIVGISDSFSLPDGRRVNVEEDCDGKDLETIVRERGPLNGEKLDGVMKQLSVALRYLHESKGIIHRDIKPSNILLSDEGIKVTDLQNAAKYSNVASLAMPTRGGTPYTHINLLNSLSSGEPSRASLRTDIYAFGATAFYLMTGELPFDYSITRDEEGKVLRVGDHELKINLRKNGCIIDEISAEEHEIELKKAIKKVPKKWRDVVYRCLTTSQKGFYESSSLETKVDAVIEDFSKRFRRNLINGVKWAGAIGAVAGLCLFAHYESEKAKRAPPKPTMLDILGFQRYKSFTLEDLPMDTKEYADEILAESFDKLKKKGHLIMQDKDAKSIINMGGNHAVSIMRYSPRIYTSLLLAGYMNEDKDVAYKRNGEDRLFPSFVPYKFALLNTYLKEKADYRDNMLRMAQGSMYLQQCIGDGDNIADVYAKYFCPREEIFAASIVSGSVQYFPRHDGEELLVGYGAALPKYKREIINDALAAYMVTDEKGVIDFGKIPSRPIIGGKLKVIDMVLDARRGAVIR